MILLLKTETIILKIQNMKKQKLKVLDTELGNKIEISADFELPQEFNLEILMAIKLVEEEMKFQKIDISNIKGVSLIILQYGDLVLRMEDIGNHIQICTINYSKISTIESVDARIAIVIEELVHKFWNISDEEKIKHIDIAILRRFNPNVVISDIFDLSTIPEDQKKEYKVLTSESFDYLFE